MTLRNGDRGEKVMQLQAALMGIGVGLPKFGVDGIFGPETEGAVKQAQQMFGMTPTGVADQPLLRELNAGEVASSNPTPGSAAWAGRGGWIMAGLAIGAIALVVKTNMEAS